MPMMAARNLVHLSEAYFRTGELVNALRCGQEALDLSRVHKQRAVEAEALRVLGEIRSVQDHTHVPAAETLYHEAITVAEPLGMRPLIGHCHLGLGKLYRRAENRVEAREHLATAVTMYREMDMGLWREKAEMEMRGLA